MPLSEIEKYQSIITNEALECLKGIPGIINNRSQSLGALVWECVGLSVPRGSITEISGSTGSGKTENLVKLLALHQESLGRIAWIEEEFTAYPPGFELHGIDLSKILFIEGRKNSLWATHQALRSGIFSAVIVHANESTLNRRNPQLELRRLQLSAEKSNAYVFLVTQQPRPQGSCWPLSLQLQIDPQSRKLTVLKHASCRLRAFS